MKLGQRVKFNENVSSPFIGKCGIITSQRVSSINGQLWVVSLDEATAPAPYWPECETLDVSEGDLIPIS